MSSLKICTVLRGPVLCSISNHIRLPAIAFSRTIATGTKSSPSVLKLSLTGLGIGCITGTGYAGYQFLTAERTKNHLVNQSQKPIVIEKFPDVNISRRVVNQKDNSGLELVLFQFQTCPFCCKVRAFLDTTGLSYSVVEVDAVLRQSLKWTQYKKVPLMLVKTADGKYLQLTDSSVIISMIASYLTDMKQSLDELATFYPAMTYVDNDGKKQADIMNKYFLMYNGNIPRKVTKETMEEERKWRSWADSHLVHLISPNVYRTKEEALQTFEWFSDAGQWSVLFPAWERNMMVYVGAFAMYMISKRLKKRHGLSDDVRSHIYDACDKWVAAIEKNKTKFLGGNEPNLADISVFGILNSMEGCQAFKDCLQNTKIGPWFAAMKDVARNQQGHLEY